MLRGGVYLRRRRAHSQAEFTEVRRRPYMRRQGASGCAARRPDEAALYRQAARASQSTDNLMLVYLVEVDGQEDLHHQIRAAGLKPLYRFPSDALRHRDRQQANEQLLGNRRLTAKDD